MTEAITKEQEIELLDEMGQIIREIYEEEARDAVSSYEGYKNYNPHVPYETPVYLREQTEREYQEHLAGRKQNVVDTQTKLDRVNSILAAMREEIRRHE